MRKKIAVLVLVTIFFLAPTLAKAAGPIEIYVDGKQVSSDVAPIIKDGRTLVPLRVISENLGANVFWDNKSRTVHIKKDFRDISLKIGQSNANINGKTNYLDVPAQIVKERTMVPLRFIGEALEAKVHWDDVQRRVMVSKAKAKVSGDILEFTYQKVNQSPAIIIKSDGNLDFKQVSTEDNSLALDIKASIKIKENTLYPDDDFVEKAFVAKIQDNPPTSRLIVKTKPGVSYKIQPSPDKSNIYIYFSNQLTDVDIDVDTEEVNVSLITLQPVEFEHFTLENPHRLVVDIKGAILNTAAPSYIKNDIVKDIRIGQFSNNPDVVRVVFDLAKNGTNYNIKQKENKILIKFTGPHTLEDIAIKSKGSHTTLTFDITDDINYKISSDKKNKRLKLTLYGTKLGRNLKDLISVGDNLIDYVETYSSDNNTQVAISLKYLANYELVTTSPSKYIKLVIYDEPMKSDLIVIDPGHGGTDPGATRNGIKEKDLNLDIALKVAKILEEHGLRVLMTRDKDISVDLYARPSIANEADADVFVSIHNNTATTPSATGTETYYYPRAESKLLATSIQQALTKKTGLKSRGIIEKPGFVVTRETNMPSVLVEVAFMSNQNDLSLLMQEDFRQKVAQGIADGILDFLSDKSN